MEYVKNINEIKNLKNNKIEGKPNLVNSTISFKGNNNILICEPNVKIVNSNLSFMGNNSIIYLSDSKSDYVVTLVLYNDSTMYFGKNNVMYSPFNVVCQEAQNFIMGDECIIFSGVNIRTSDAHPIYDGNSKKRINFSQSVFIGDHVWIGQLTYISRGVKIGSGSIIGNTSFLPPLFEVSSNCYGFGNPFKIVNKNVFFTKDFVGNFKSDDTLNFSSYKSDVFLYNFVNKETLNLNEIDRIIKSLIVEERLHFIKELFVKNKRKNRFTIGY
ncbi:LbetaH domain-containing protein [Methanobrevibacter gottschalkii]|uniref:acetyltransferase n=1 Tax=Methanobrevibacter gottschalkii TaxID=190974 RepID=UPI0038D0D17B